MCRRSELAADRRDFLPDEVAAADLGGWAALLPVGCRIFGASLFADLFLADAGGAVHMLQVAAASVDRIAASEAEFRRRCVDDEDGWLLRPLAERCRASGLIPAASQCYAFTVLPMLGGDYEVGNIWLCGWEEWIRFTADVHEQTKDLPDGTKVSFQIVG